jgi:uncharacterized Ntn-hydrolase superfamily protein
VTYSIVARDPETGELGVAVQSRAFGVGLCAWTRPNVGAVATQSFTERGYGPRGLDLLAGGAAPADALAELLAADDQRDFRQVAFLDAQGRAAAHTGDACIRDCGHLTAENVSVQGNMLASVDVWPAMLEAFERAEGALEERLLDALDAGEAAGGDFRGRQASTLVVAPGDPEAPPWQRSTDLRVDDHPEPLAELRRLLAIRLAMRRRASFAPGTSVEEEVERARAAGLREDEVAVTAALAAGANGDVEAVVAALRPVAAADPRWLEAFERYERLGFMPPGIRDLL